MQAYLAVTDSDWFTLLSREPGIDEVNFWKPGGGAGFRALSLGGPLLFKLRWPENAIVGGGFFASFSRLPVSIAWDTFKTKNGVRTFEEMRRRIEQLRHTPPAPREDYEIGNIVLQDPFFLRREQWIPAPADFHRNIVSGKSYDLSVEPGKSLWAQVMAARSIPVGRVAERALEIPGPMFGEAQRGRVRLHQGAFRVMLTDAYSRRCAISGEKALPVLEAAHIKPVSEGGENRLDNGLLLRSDIHTLFDRGYITVTPEKTVLVASRALKEDFDNGEPYAPLHGTSLLGPGHSDDQPSSAQLVWHNEHRFRG